MEGPLQQKVVFNTHKIKILLFVLSILISINVVYAYGADQPENTKQILIFFSYPLGTPWQDKMSSVFFHEIQSNSAMKTSILSDFPWISTKYDSSYEDLLIEFYKHKYEDHKIDIIVSTSEASTKFLLTFGDLIFPEVPVVALPGPSKEILERVREKPNWTGVFSEKRIKETIDVSIQLLPDTKNIAVISGSSNSGHILELYAMDVLKDYIIPLNTIYLSDIPMDDIIEQVAELPSDTIILYLTTLLDSTGKEFIPKDILKEITKAANSPVFGLWDTILGSGIVGGYMVSPELDGKSLSEIVLRILEGESIENIPVGKALNGYYFDWEQLQKWRIDVNSLPKDSVLINQEFSFWDQYKNQIIGIILIIILEAILIIMLFIQKTKLGSARISLIKSQKELELKVLERTKALFQTNQKLEHEIKKHKKAKKHIQNLLDGKELLLKEVHHRIKNNMTTLIGIFSIQSMSNENPEVTRILEDTGNRIHSMMLLYDKLYRGTDYQNISVKEYLNTLINEIILNFNDVDNISLETEIEDLVIDSKIIFNIGIIVNELITNTMKYAFPDGRSGRLIISFLNRDNHVVLTVRDNGIGVDGNFDIESSKGFGLKLVKLLTEQINGSIEVDSVNGTTFTLEFEV